MSNSQLIIDQEAALADFFARGGVVQMLETPKTDREKREDRFAKAEAKAKKEAEKQARKAARKAKQAERQLETI